MSEVVDLMIEPRDRSLSAVIVQVDVTAVSGTTPQLDVVIEESVDNINWYTLMVFTTRTAPGNQLMKKSDPAQHVRATWTISGTTPSFTFSISYVTRT